MGIGVDNARFSEQCRAAELAKRKGGRKSKDANSLKGDQVDLFEKNAYSDPAPTHAALQALLGKIITRILRLMTRLGYLIEDEGETYVAGGFTDPDDVMVPLQAAST